MRRDGKVQVLDGRLGGDRHNQSLVERKQDLSVVFGDHGQRGVEVGAQGCVADEVKVVGVGQIRRADRGHVPARGGQSAQCARLGDAENAELGASRAI